MRMFLVSDNIDTQKGLELAGIDGIVVSHDDPKGLKSVLEGAIKDKSIGILLITEKLAKIFPEYIEELKLKQKLPLFIEIPDRHGTGRTPDSITRYVREAIGIKI